MPLIKQKKISLKRILLLLFLIVIVPWSILIWELSKENSFSLIFMKTDERVITSELKPINNSIYPYQNIVKVIEEKSNIEEVNSKDIPRGYAAVNRADIDGDAKPDSIMGSGMHLNIDVSLKRKGYRQTIGNSEITSVGFDDVDSDGFLDAWWCDVGDDRIGVLWGNGKGSFKGKQIFSTQYRYPRKAAFFDADGDGNLDIVLAAAETVTTEPEQLRYFWIKLEKKN